MPSKLTAAVALSLAALTLTACGSSGSGGSGASAGASSSSGGSAGGGVLRVGTEGTYAPFSFHDPKTNDLTGYDVDVARAVGEDLGMEVRFSEVPFDGIFAGMESGRYDVIVNQVTVTPERQAEYDFSTPYTVSGGAILTKAGDSSISSLADLRGKTTAQSSTSNWAQVAKDAGAQVQAVEGFTEAVALVKQGRVDATVNDELAVRNYLRTTKDTSVEIAADAGSESQQAIVLPKGSPLTPRVDEALAALQADGTLATISEQYFGTDVTR